MNEVTQWFPPEIMPKHKGHYQRDWSLDYLIESPDYFDGQYWYLVEDENKFSLPNDKPWRGIANKS